MFKTIIIDDEAFNRQQLRFALQDQNLPIEIIAEANNGEEGLHKIVVHQPDLVFLDIEMPKMNGFEMLKQLQNPKFEVIFITAHNHYAIQAIKFSALDYILKPFENSELESALKRFLEKKQQENELKSQLQNLMSNLQKPITAQKIAIASAEGIQYFPLQSIVRFEAMSNYTKLIFTKGKAVISSKNIGFFEKELCEFGFIRVHKKHIVNKLHIVSLLNFRQIELTNGEFIEISKRRLQEVKLLLNSTLAL